MTVEQALEIHQRVSELVEDSQLQQAIDLLEGATERGVHDAAIAFDLKIMLATTLYLADEFSRAAPVFDAVLPAMADGRRHRRCSATTPESATPRSETSIRPSNT